MSVLHTQQKSKSSPLLVCLCCNFEWTSLQWEVDGVVRIAAPLEGTEGQMHKDWRAAVDNSLFWDCLAPVVGSTLHCVHIGFCPNDKKVQKQAEIRHLRSEELKLPRQAGRNLCPSSLGVNVLVVGCVAGSEQDLFANSLISKREILAPGNTMSMLDCCRTRLSLLIVSLVS